MFLRLSAVSIVGVCLLAQGPGGGRGPRPMGPGGQGPGQGQGPGGQAGGRSGAGGPGQGGAATQAQTANPDEKPGSVSGQIVAATGEPLNKAEVSLRSVDGGARRGNFSVTTDASGAFSFAQIPPGRYAVMAQRSGYVAMGNRMRGGSLVTVTSGNDTTGFVVKMVRQAVVSGRVFDEDGEPMQHASVQVLSQRFMRGKKQLQPVGGGQVNDLGEYRIPNLSPGKYVVSVNRPRTRPGWNGPAKSGADAPEEGYATVYYPNATDPAQAVVIDAAAGNDIRSIDFTLRKTRVFRVKGTVIDGSGNQPVDRAIVMLVPSGTIGGFMGRSTAGVRNGAFELSDVLPGSYTLIANQVGQRGRPVGSSAQVPVQVGSANVEGVTLTVVPSVELAGRVTVEDTQTPPSLTQVRVSLEGSSGMGMGMGMGAPQTNVAADATFKMADAGPGTYKLNVSNLPDGMYLKAVRIGNQDVSQTGFDAASAAAGMIDVVLSPKAASVDAVIMDPKQRPVSSMQAVLIPEASKRDQWNLYKTANSDQNGAVHFKSVPPGEYLLISWEEADDQTWQDPEILKKFESQGVKLKLSESARESVQVKIILAENSSLDKDDAKKPNQ